MPYTSERLRSRNPFELFLLVITIITGGTGLLNHRFRPGSIQESIGVTGTVIWSVFLFAGAVTALVGIFLHERAWGLTAESIGCFLVGGATVFYGLAAMILFGDSALYPGGITVAFGAAAIWRATQIAKTISTVAREHTGNSEE